MAMELWLTDEMINQCMESINNHNHTNGIAVYCSNSYLLPLVIKKREDDILLSRLCWTLYRDYRIHKLDKFVIPVNVANAHWILVVVCVTTNVICIYDSYNSDYRFMDRNTLVHVLEPIRYLMRMYGKIYSVGKFHEEPWSTMVCPYLTCQADSYSCGVYVILAAFINSMKMNYYIWNIGISDLIAEAVHATVIDGTWTAEEEIALPYESALVSKDRKKSRCVGRGTILELHFENPLFADDSRCHDAKPSTEFEDDIASNNIPLDIIYYSPGIVPANLSSVFSVRLSATTKFYLATYFCSESLIPTRLLLESVMRQTDVKTVIHLSLIDSRWESQKQHCYLVQTIDCTPSLFMESMYSLKTCFKRLKLVVYKTWEDYLEDYNSGVIPKCNLFATDQRNAADVARVSISRYETEGSATLYFDHNPRFGTGVPFDRITKYLFERGTKNTTITAKRIENNSKQVLTIENVLKHPFPLYHNENVLVTSYNLGINGEITKKEIH
jgi:hypothetical protein